MLQLLGKPASCITSLELGNLLSSLTSSEKVCQAFCKNLSASRARVELPYILSLSRLRVAVTQRIAGYPCSFQEYCPRNHDYMLLNLRAQRNIRRLYQRNLYQFDLVAHRAVYNSVGCRFQKHQTSEWGSYQVPLPRFTCCYHIFGGKRMTTVSYSSADNEW